MPAQGQCWTTCGALEARDHISIAENTSTRDMRGMTAYLPDQQVINSAGQCRRRHRGTSDLENRPRLIPGVVGQVAVHHRAVPFSKDRPGELVQPEPIRTPTTRAANAVGDPSAVLTAASSLLDPQRALARPLPNHDGATRGWSELISQKVTRTLGLVSQAYAENLDCACALTLAGITSRGISRRSSDAGSLARHGSSMK